MGLSKAGSAVEEDRIILFSTLSYGNTGSMGKAVSGTDDKRIKGIICIQLGRRCLRADRYGIGRELMYQFQC